MIPASVNSRTRVHEYGGASFYPIGNNGDLITSDFATQGLRLIKNGVSGTVHDVVINDTPGKLRYADFVIGPSASSRDGCTDNRLLYAVREDHSIDEPFAIVNSIVCFPVLSADGSAIVTAPESHSILVNQACDPDIMMSNPRVDPSGTYLAWVQWCHPNMPWDDSKLFVAKLSADGLSLISEPVCVAGGIGESVLEPMWWTPPGNM